MAFQIDFDKKVGEMVCVSPDFPKLAPVTYDIFDSNNLLSVYRVTRYEGFYPIKMPIFNIINEDHLFNMLGLTPGHKNYLKTVVVKLTLYRSCRNYERIAYLFHLAIPDLDIEIIDG